MSDETKLDRSRSLGRKDENKRRLKEPRTWGWPAKVGAIAGLLGATALVLGLFAAGLDWVVSRSVAPIRTELATVGAELGKVRNKIDDLNDTLSSNGERLAKVEVRVDHLDQQIQRLYDSLSALDVPPHLDDEALVSQGP